MTEIIINQGDGWKIVKRDGENTLITDSPDHWMAECFRQRKRTDEEYEQLTANERDCVKLSLLIGSHWFAGLHWN